MAIFNIAKLTSIGYAAVETDGSFPATLTTITANKIKESTATITIPEQALTALYSEGSSVPPVILEGNIESPMLEAELFLDDAASISDLMSGTYTAQGTGTLENVAFNGASDSLKVLALRLVGLNSNGEYIDYSFPKCKLTQVFDGTVGKSDAKGYVIKGYMMSPFDTSWVEQDWFINNVGVAGS